MTSLSSQHQLIDQLFSGLSQLRATNDTHKRLSPHEVKRIFLCLCAFRSHPSKFKYVVTILIILDMKKHFNILGVSCQIQKDLPLKVSF